METVLICDPENKNRPWFSLLVAGQARASAQRHLQSPARGTTVVCGGVWSRIRPSWRSDEGFRRSRTVLFFRTVPFFSGTSPQMYAYPGGTLHLAPWAWLVVALTFLWLIWYHGGPGAFQNPRHFLILLGLFVILPTFLASWLEWLQKDQAGRIMVSELGLTCTLPWRRQRQLRWEDIREVRCIARQLHPNFSFWEIRGPTPKDRITFSWQLKGYKGLLRTIQNRATRCEHFDSID